jgi:hypothetical protein
MHEPRSRAADASRGVISPDPARTVTDAHQTGTRHARPSRWRRWTARSRSATRAPGPQALTHAHEVCDWHETPDERSRDVHLAVSVVWVGPARHRPARRPVPDARRAARHPARHAPDWSGPVPRSRPPVAWLKWLWNNGHPRHSRARRAGTHRLSPTTSLRLAGASGAREMQSPRHPRRPRRRRP